MKIAFIIIIEMFKSKKIKIIVLVAACIFTWSSSITDQYDGYDGLTLIKNNESIKQGIINAVKIYFGTASQSHNVAWTNEATGIYRPLEGVNCAISYSLWQDNVICHHLLHIGLHLLNTMLVFMILSVLFKTGNHPFWITLLWTVHPLHNESLNMLTSAQGYLTAMLWMFIALLLSVTGSKRVLIRAVAIFVLGLTAHLTSEHTVIAPLLVLILMLVYNRMNNLSIKLNTVQLIFVISSTLATLSYLVIRSRVFMGVDQLVSQSVSENLERTFVLAPQVLLYYFKLFLVPIKLSMDHKHIIYLDNILSIYHIFSMALALLLIYFICTRLYYRDRSHTESAIAVSLLGGIVGIMLTLGVIPLYTLAREIYTYIFCLGLVSALVIGLHKLLASKQKLQIVILVLIASLWSARSFVRNLDWRNGEVFWLATKKLCPDPAVKQIWNYKLISYLNNPGTDTFQPSPGLVPVIYREFQDFIDRYGSKESIEAMLHAAALPENYIKNKYGYSFAQSMSAAFYCLGLLSQNQNKNSQAYYLYQIAHKYNPENFEVNFWLFLYEQTKQITNGSPYFRQMLITAEHNPFLCKRVIDALSLANHPQYLKYAQLYADKYPNQAVFAIYLQDAQRRHNLK